eukprot:13722427-Alexandrium_andersonii.AAC.1
MPELPGLQVSPFCRTQGAFADACVRLYHLLPGLPSGVLDQAEAASSLGSSTRLPRKGVQGHCSCHVGAFVFLPGPGHPAEETESSHA